jgi:hypothetical protein
VMACLETHSRPSLTWRVRVDQLGDMHSLAISEQDCITVSESVPYASLA